MRKSFLKRAVSRCQTSKSRVNSSSALQKVIETFAPASGSKLSFVYIAKKQPNEFPLSELRLSPSIRQSSHRCGAASRTGLWSHRAATSGWRSALSHHSHIHMIVPSGGLSPDGTRWVTCKPRFFLHVQGLSRLFRRLFFDGLQALHRARELRSMATSKVSRAQMPSPPGSSHSA